MIAIKICLYIFVRILVFYFQTLYTDELFYRYSKINMASRLIISQILFIQFFKFCWSFYDFELNNQTYPGWHTYQYLPTELELRAKFVERTYILSEQSPRGFIMCPKGFVIDSLASSFLVPKINRSDDEDSSKPQKWSLPAGVLKIKLTIFQAVFILYVHTTYIAFEF